MMKKCLFALCFFAATAYGQTITNQVLKYDVAALQNIRLQQPVEKLYVQTDKPYYTCGDTLRFKAYLLNDFLTPSTRSSLPHLSYSGSSSGCQVPKPSTKRLYMQNAAAINTVSYISRSAAFSLRATPISAKHFFLRIELCIQDTHLANFVRHCLIYYWFIILI